ncbi:MAG: hypothetical protein LBH68_04985, partial [Bifidobacteriaceae bacterium]|nr:hypothetical protein [Bifidobacteriaceae bacterium]
MRVYASFRLRLAAAIAALTAAGLAAAGGLTYLLELRRTDARITESLGRAVAELHNYSNEHSSAGLARVISGAVAQSVNADYECTLGTTDSPSAASATSAVWTHAGGSDMCRRVLADPTLQAALGRPDPSEVRVQHLTSAAGGYAYVTVPVTSESSPDAAIYAVVMDRASQRDVVTASYLRGYLPLAVLAVLLTSG